MLGGIFIFQIPKDDPYPEDTVKDALKEPEEPRKLSRRQFIF